MSAAAGVFPRRTARWRLGRFASIHVFILGKVSDFSSGSEWIETPGWDYMQHLSTSPSTVTLAVAASLPKSYRCGWHKNYDWWFLQLGHIWMTWQSWRHTMFENSLFKVSLLSDELLRYQRYGEGFINPHTEAMNQNMLHSEGFVISIQWERHVPPTQRRERGSLATVA